MAATTDYQHEIRAPVPYSLIERRVKVDEVGRARDPATGHIVNIGQRERLPLVSVAQHEKQVRLKEDFSRECKELRTQRSGLLAQLAEANSRVSDLEQNQGPLLEEIAYLRSLTGVIYEKHRIDAYHNLGLGMRNDRLEAEVNGLRCASEREASGWKSDHAQEERQEASPRDDRLVSELEARVRAQDDEIESLRAALARQPKPVAKKADPPGTVEFCERVFKCQQQPPGVGYRNSPDFADKNDDGRGPQFPQCIIADAICQGPKAIFVHCTSGRGWLPVTDPSGTRVLFQHLGTTDTVDMDELEFNKGRVKGGQGASFAVGGDKRVVDTP